MRRYIAEWNRVLGDNIRRAATRLQKKGVLVSVLPHKTALLIERPDEMGWIEFKNLVRNELNRRHGSVLLFSESTGNTFICQYRGNRPGRFQRV